MIPYKKRVLGVRGIPFALAPEIISSMSGDRFPLKPTKENVTCSQANERKLNCGDFPSQNGRHFVWAPIKRSDGTKFGPERRPRENDHLCSKSWEMIMILLGCCRSPSKKFNSLLPHLHVR